MNVNGREVVVCLHGALGVKEQFEPLFPLFPDHLEVLAFDFEGHGAQAAEFDRPLRIENLVKNVTNFLDKNGIQQANFFGYSMGGYVATVLAHQDPSKVKSVFTLGTKYFWTPEVARKEASYLDIELITKKVPSFARLLQFRHGDEGHKRVLARTQDLLLHLGDHNLLNPAVLGEVTPTVCVAVGDRDKMVGWEETSKVYKCLPRGQFCVLPKSGHALEEVALGPLSGAIKDFFLPTRGLPKND